MNVVLLEPEIPYNTGAIGRTCAASGTRLHLVRPFGFDITEKHIKRAGLDYWRYLDVSYYDDWSDFISKNEGKNMFFATTKARNCYADAEYKEGDYLVFGKESAGLPESLLKANADRCIRVPMAEKARSLNLSVSVGIVLYEAQRQVGFPFLR